MADYSLADIAAANGNGAFGSGGQPVVRRQRLPAAKILVNLWWGGQ